jgi:hypothetical protein
MAALKFKAASLPGDAVEVLGQLFVSGPTWDGNIISKAGRSALISAGLAFKVEGFTSLTEDGLRMAIEWNVKDWADKRWYRKQNRQ